MSKEQENKVIVSRWFTEFWGPTCNLDIVDELAAPDMLLQYSLHEPRHGHEDIKAFMSGFREAFPDLKFWGAADLIAEGDYVVGRWEGGGPTPGQLLLTSWPDLWGRQPVARCISPEQRCCESRTARSRRKSASMMA